MYADLLIKPEEIMLYPPVNQRGFSLVSVKHKALASLLCTFLELSCNPKFITSIYLPILFRVHVKGENLPAPSLPPYYNRDFINNIIKAVEMGHNVAMMSTKKWYWFLLELEVTMTEPPGQPW